MNYQEKLMPLMFGDHNVLEQGEKLLQAAEPGKAKVAMGQEPSVKPQELENGIEKIGKFLKLILD